MNRDKKSDLVDRISRNFSTNTSFVLINFCANSCETTTAFRRVLHQSDAKLMFVKNSLARVALAQDDLEYLSSEFRKTIAVASSNDIVSLSKVACSFCDSSNGVANVVCGASSHDGFLPFERLKLYSSLPPLGDIQLQILNSVNSFILNDLLGAISYAPRSIISLLNVKCESN